MHRRYWACQLAGWGLYVIVTTLGAWRAVSHLRAVVEPIGAAALGIALTHRYRAFVRARGWRDLDTRALAWRVVAASFALAAIFVAVVWPIEVVCFDATVAVLGPVIAWIRWTPLFFVWSAIYVGLVVLLDWRVLRERHAHALRTAELAALKAQLNPHFLFNALNSVRALIALDPSRAQDAVTQLAHTLRYALGATREEVVTIEHELAMVDDYLELEALRFGARLRVEREIAPLARQGRIPVLLLQTLVENAVKHGIARLPEGGTLRMAAHFEPDRTLVVDVENPRPEASPADDEVPGARLGLVNALERLQLLFGAGATLALDLTDTGHARSRVRIPQAS